MHGHTHTHTHTHTIPYTQHPTTHLTELLIYWTLHYYVWHYVVGIVETIRLLIQLLPTTVQWVCALFFISFFRICSSFSLLICFLLHRVFSRSFVSYELLSLLLPCRAIAWVKNAILNFQQRQMWQHFELQVNTEIPIWATPPCGAFWK